MRLKICDSHLTCKVANKCLNVRERVEVVEWNKMVPSFPLLSCELSVTVKENPDRKKKFLKKTLHLSGRLLFLKKWNNESIVSNVVMNLTPLYISNSTHRNLSWHKCKKKICHHKILVNFQFKSPYGNGRVSINHVQRN